MAHLKETSQMTINFQPLRIPMGRQGWPSLAAPSTKGSHQAKSKSKHPT